MNCFQKVYGTLEGTSRWKGVRPCKGKVVGYAANADGSVKFYFCRKHEKDCTGLTTVALTKP